MWLIPKQCKQIRARENITRHIGKVSWCKCRHTVTCTISMVHTLSGPDVWTITEEKEGYVVDGHICRQNEKDKEVYQICKIYQRKFRGDSFGLLERTTHISQREEIVRRKFIIICLCVGQ